MHTVEPLGRVGRAANVEIVRDRADGVGDGVDVGEVVAGGLEGVGLAETGLPGQANVVAFLRQTKLVPSCR